MSNSEKNSFTLTVFATCVSVSVVILFHVAVKWLLDVIFIDHVYVGLGVILALALLRHLESNYRQINEKFSEEEISEALKEETKRTSLANDTKKSSADSIPSSQKMETEGNGSSVSDEFSGELFIGNTLSDATNTSESDQIIVNSKHSNRQRIVCSEQHLTNEIMIEGLARQDISNMLGSRTIETDQSNKQTYEQSIRQSEQKACRINLSTQEVKNYAINLNNVKQKIEKSEQFGERTSKSRQKISNMISKSDSEVTVRHVGTEGEPSEQVIRTTKQHLTETKEATQDIRNSAQNESNIRQVIQDSFQIVTSSGTAREVIQSVKNEATGRHVSQTIHDTVLTSANCKRVVQAVGNR
ncbi:hypothetical protein Btru_070390 [Bulinus truncatus]|nr:hypothetical protein Btru_070390 [Bulinus truncatus]